jgi:flagellar basal body-associated protein FliL
MRETTCTSIRKEDRKMIWLLLNLLMAVPFFAVWVGVPLWLVFKHPDRGHERSAASAPAHSHQAEPAEPQLVLVP